MQPELECELVRSASDSRTRTAVGNEATLLDHLGMDRENRRGGEGGRGGREEQKDIEGDRRGKRKRKDGESE